jgi:hypothetical protein
MVISNLFQVVLFLLFVSGLWIFPFQPAVGFLLAAGAVWISGWFPSSLGDGLELLGFYGALFGIWAFVFL